MMTNSSVRSSLKSGLFWDVGPYLSEFSNLAKIAPELKEAASIEGVLYGVPFQKNLARSGLIFRKDWLDKLGLPVPKTLDEVYEVARAFTEDDPDGNGVKDTTGFGDRSELKYSSFKTLSSYFGTPNGWKVDDSGKFIPEFDTTEYMDTMNFSKSSMRTDTWRRISQLQPKRTSSSNSRRGRPGSIPGWWTSPV